MRNKKITYGRMILLIGILMFLICSTMYVNSVASENAIGNIIVSPSSQTMIEIYTYGDEYYRAIGSLNIVNNEKDNSGYILELDGKLEKIKTKEKDITEHPLSKIPIVLNVYEGDIIYGFYSNKEIEIYRNGKTTNIVMYGFLEAYYDGSYNFSG